MDSSKNKVDGSGRRKQTRIKRGMKGLCARATQHRLKMFNITSNGMKATELLDHLKQRRRNSDKTKREEMDELIKDTHEEEKEIKKVKAKTTERRTVMNSDDPIHGSWKTNSKDKNDLTFISINVNSLAHWSRESNKAERLKYIFEKYSIDAAGLQEVCMNWAQLPSPMTLAQILRRTVENIRSVTSYNKIEGKEVGAGKVQRGGTATIMREELTAYVTRSGVDPSGLGQWSWYLLEGVKGYQTRVVTAYTPCGRSACNSERPTSNNKQYT